QECPLYPRKRTFAVHYCMSALGQKRTHAVQQKGRYSITLSALVSSVGGIVSPSALAVLRLVISSMIVGCSRGRSAGLAPLRILSTKYAARRKSATLLGP